MSSNLDKIFLIGRPVSPLYSLIMKLRSACYQKRLIKSYKLKVPVISVGNLTMGGTGKTPMVQYLTTLLLKQGYTPAIVSRGYGGKSKEVINVVADNHNILMNASDAGDEPRLLAESLPGTPVLTGKKRIHPCRFALEHLNVDLIILDDGYQHLAMQRDLDIVLFNASSLTNNMHVFPGGVLRESFSALSRATCLIITGVENELTEDTNSFIHRCKQLYPQKPIFISSYTPKYAKEKNVVSHTSLRALPSALFGFCGIASPQRFQDSLRSCDIHLQGFTTFRDHQTYSQDLINNIERNALQANCKAILTTEKDFVKLQRFSFSMPLFSIVMQTRVQKDFDAFVDKQLSSFSH